ncbi:MAG: fumarate hydratase [bacterium]
MPLESLKETLVELFRKTATDLPFPIESSLKAAIQEEEPGSLASYALQTILENITIAREKSVPLCQDTGYITCYVHLPSEIKHREIEEALLSAEREAVERFFLRPNAVDPVSGKNSGTGIGLKHPDIHFRQTDSKEIRFSLLLKGGGCENIGSQYKLPDVGLKAGRDLEGVRRCVLDMVNKAQGKGCAPGVLGIGIGGDRASSYSLAKEQFFRPFDDTSPVPELAALEKRLKKEINQLGIGPMGLGGKTTVSGVKIGAIARIPASYFVSISYMCWAYRAGIKTIAL